jgi:Kinase/pyrophosphorylase
LVHTQEQLERALTEIEEAPGIVLYTMFDEDLVKRIEDRCRQLRLPCLSLLSPVVQFMRSNLGAETDGQSPIERRLSEQPVGIRDAARTLSQEFTVQIDELRRFKPNDPGRLAEHHDLVDFFKKMAAGLANLADALDGALRNATDGKPEPALLGTAGKIAEQLHVGLMEWLEANRTFAVEIPIRLAFFGAGVAFLHSIAVDGIPAIAGLTALVLKRGPKPSKKSPSKKGA